MAVKKKTAAPKVSLRRSSGKIPAGKRGKTAPVAEAAPAASVVVPASKGKGGGYIGLALVAVLVGLGLQTYYVSKAKEAMKFDFVRNGKIISQGLANGEATGPTSIVCGPQGDIFFLDGQERPQMRLQKFDHSLTFVAKYKPKVAEGDLSRTRALGIDAKGMVYALTEDNRVVVLDNNMKFVNAFKVAVNDPSCMTADNEGRVYISSRADNKIQVYGPDGRSLGEFGAPGTKTGDIAAPARLTMSNQDELVVLEDLPGAPRIKVFNKDHKLERSFPAPGLKICPPVMMGMNKQGLLIINDPAGANAILVFRIATGKEIGIVKGTDKGDLFVAPGGCAANRFTDDLYVHTIPGLIPCTMPAGH